MPFRDIVGHRKILALLARSVDRASVPPSLIFAGPAGIGKRLVAIATAQAFNCLSPRRPERASATEPLHVDACGSCAACSRIARGVHPDVPIVEPGDSGSIKIDPIRDIIERSAYRPFEGRRRVVIIDDADALVPAAQNALLKTLEEPPSASMFVLVSARPDALLPTVQSRCPKLRFRPLSQEEIASVLLKQGRSEHEARTIAASADGSLGRALEASGDDLVEARDMAMRVLVHASTGDDPRRRIEGAKELLVKTGGSGSSDREQLAIALRAMSSLLRDIELIDTNGDRRALANPDLESALGRLTLFKGERGVRAFQAVDQGLVALERNAGVKVVADWVTLNL